MTQESPAPLFQVSLAVPDFDIIQIQLSCLEKANSSTPQLVEALVPACNRYTPFTGQIMPQLPMLSGPFDVNGGLNTRIRSSSQSPDVSMSAAPAYRRRESRGDPQYRHLASRSASRLSRLSLSSMADWEASIRYCPQTVASARTATLLVVLLIASSEHH
ncbi:hypothetical protein K458DRAFT_395109 [Lentithecium fluviatile CBS 122367]|uniref:Uncharacterized protein n=1 Tax=Lentithecium fluviatile CBS 122367 TaxID=1168545 RepID=A0A6G1IJX9_9PLEO|nr:hypothetical protein K458DRAFT_395109 [Lentithecium fluviatile CBS 122367]